MKTPQYYGQGAARGVAQKVQMAFKHVNTLSFNMLKHLRRASV
jgi:hypothetical protein